MRFKKKNEKKVLPNEMFLQNWSRVFVSRALRQNCLIPFSMSTTYDHGVNILEVETLQGF